MSQPPSILPFLRGLCALQAPTAVEEGSAHIWVFPVSGELAAIPLSPERLSPDERERANRFRLDRDRERFTRARCLLRGILSRYLRKAPEAIAFRYGPQGKPALAGSPSGICFNLSHSGDWGALAIATEAIGIDLEAIRPELDAEALARRFFSRADNEWLQSRPQEQRQRDFYRLWVAREARLKATGEGLIFPLDRLQARFMKGRLTALAEADGSVAWHIHELALVDGYCAALAMAHPQPQITTFRLDSVATAG